MTDSTENTNATSPKSTKLNNSNSLVQNQTKPKSQFQFVPRDTEESEFLDLVDFGDVAFSVETVIPHKDQKICCSALGCCISFCITRCTMVALKIRLNMYCKWQAGGRGNPYVVRHQKHEKWSAPQSIQTAVSEGYIHYNAPKTPDGEEDWKKGGGKRGWSRKEEAGGEGGGGGGGGGKGEDQ